MKNYYPIQRIEIMFQINYVTRQKFKFFEEL